MSREVQVRFCERVGVNSYPLLLYSTKTVPILISESSFGCDHLIYMCFSSIFH